MQQKKGDNIYCCLLRCAATKKRKATTFFITLQPKEEEEESDCLLYCATKKKKKKKADINITTFTVFTIAKQKTKKGDGDGREGTHLQSSHSGSYVRPSRVCGPISSVLLSL
jgi:hypothetical protein